MKSWKEALVPPTTTIKKIIAAIDASSTQIALVVDKEKRLLGTVTDGDVRRGILKGVPLDAPVERIMKRGPVTAPEGESRERVLALMKERQVHQIPLVDAKGRVTGLELLDEILAADTKDNWVVLMAGGLGSRLKPLTDDRPKPLLNVGKKPILETILENFIECGFRRFYISVNYKNEMVKAHFGDGEAWGVSIRYLHEESRLGTAGPLGLLPEKPTSPVFVMNGDLLTKVNFRQLLQFHRENRTAATMCVREYDFQVPYGVVRTEHDRVTGIDEKPVHRFFVNAGIYVLEPRALKMVKRGKPLDMPQLFEALMKKKEGVAAFPVREYWLDIGRVDDLERANGDFVSVFEGGEARR